MTRRPSRGPRAAPKGQEPESILPAEPFNPRLARAARRRATVDLAIAGAAAITLLAVAAFSQRVFVDGDTNWHVAAGRWILAHGRVPDVDPFSFTNAGRPWLAHEWLAEVLMALAYDAAGWGGVVLLIGLAAGAAYAMIAAELRLWLGPVGQIVGLALSFALLQPFLYARPHILAAPLLVFWTRQLLAARRSADAPPLALAPLMIVWANLHGSFIFGLAVIVPFALEAITEGRYRLRMALRWGFFALVATAFSLATPHGFAGLFFPFQVLGMKVLPSILEWRAANFQQPTLFEAALLATLFLGLWRGVRAPIFRLMLLIGLLHMALQHVRQEAVLAVLAPLLLAEPFGRAGHPSREGPRIARPVGWRPSSRVPSWPVALTVAAIACTVVGARLEIPLVRKDNPNVPVSAMAHVPPALLSQPVFNEYAFGGYLIFKGVRPFIDGRADMYGDAFVQQYLAIAGGDPALTDQSFKRWRIGWAIISPRDGLVRLLASRPDWRRIYADPYAVVFERNPPAKPAGPG